MLRRISLLVLWCACGSVNKADKMDAACVAETDVAFCSRIGNACESRTEMDNCGVQRTVDCGACSGVQGCVAGTCKTPVCTTFTYTSAAIPELTQSGIEDSLGAATPDGQVIVYIKTVPVGSACQGFHVVIGDETSPGAGTYTLQDVNTQFGNLGLFTGQDAHTITADGLTVISRSNDSKRLLATTRSAIHMTDFGAASSANFDAINNQVVTNGGTFVSPVISADGLELFYSLGASTDPANNGIYSAVRASTSVPFPAGTKLPAPVDNYNQVGGVSSDRLTLFLFSNFQGHVLKRTSTSQPFTNPNAPSAPPVIPNWHHQPLADCSKLIAMQSAGGCNNEDVVKMTRQ